VIALAQPWRQSFDSTEEIRILKESDLHHLSNSGTPITIRKARKETIVVDDCVWWSERADEVFLPERIDAILYANTSVALRESRSRQPKQSHPTMSCRSREAHGVEYCAATNGDDK
jgi:hypothetical protein